MRTLASKAQVLPGNGADKQFDATHWHLGRLFDDAIACARQNRPGHDATPTDVCAPKTMTTACPCTTLQTTGLEGPASRCRHDTWRLVSRSHWNAVGIDIAVLSGLLVLRPCARHGFIRAIAFAIQ
ncbi:hypothetical protein H310_06165 [Aphanomyces invadans]|uniref:Uncharacterized protein n=1 Tax=Aphanomyces invadans TaxID=157072 RepID=A0A024U6I8_9STRA|nr:hypothetical protein H310_06165 [Aphanomyces invadans]ETW01492.1 hypothetical protein H310_06165 [Aphanomyces invadans]|eukprot:XP_008869340.1 hypothetical protein H310_06165 [Aphanomyces invadans]